MKMGKMVVTGMVVMGMAAVSGYAQDVPPKGPFGGAGPRAERRPEMRPRGGDRPGFNRMGMGSNEEMLFRLVRDPEVAKEIELAPEKAEAMKRVFEKVQQRQIDLQAELAKLHLRQTGEVAGLLSDRAKTADEAMKLLEEIGRTNLELSKLMVERILVVRENLTDAQIAKAREIAKKRMEKVREAMQNREGGRRNREGGENRPEGPRPNQG